MSVSVIQNSSYLSRTCYKPLTNIDKSIVSEKFIWSLFTRFLEITNLLDLSWHLILLNMKPT